MFLSLLLSISLILLQVSPPSSGYSGGAPNQACSLMTPNHGQEKQTSSPPYTLTTNATEVEGGQRIVVTLKADIDHFQGFLIQGRDQQDDSLIGKFHTPTYKVIDCVSGVSNAVTHKNPDKDEEITVEWQAPYDYEGDVAFRATMVREFKTYWVGLTSEKVSVQKRSVSADKPPVEVAVDPKVGVGEKLPKQGLAKALNDLYNDCGTLKSCVGLPSGCADKKNCKTLLTYTKSAGDEYEFELKGGQVRDNRYVGVGLSFDQNMGSDSVVLCSVSDNTVDVTMRWNEGRSNQPVVDPKLGITVLESGLFEGELYCRFLRKKRTDLKSHIFNLETEKYHIMLAEGPMSEASEPLYHSTSRLVSARPVNLGETSNLAVRDGRIFRLIHGCLMIGAWVCTASIGIIFARYYKQTWVQFKCCSMDQWFHAHRFFMIATWCLTMAAFILIIVELGEWRPSTHSWIGLSSVILCFIQPFMAALRPHPGTKRRPIFNWVHWFVGNAAQILGVTAIFYGLDLFLGSEKNWVKETGWYIVIGFIVFHCVVHLTLSVAQCISDQRKAANDIFPLKELTDSRVPLNPDDKRRDAPLACFRKFILAIYLPIIWILTAALIILVAVKREHIEGQLRDWGSPEFWERDE